MRLTATESARSDLSILTTWVCALTCLFPLACRDDSSTDAATPLRARTVVHLVDHQVLPAAARERPTQRARVGGVSMEVLRPAPLAPGGPGPQAIRTSPIRVSEGDVLELSIGVSTPKDARPATPVHFAVVALSDARRREIFAERWPPAAPSDAPQASAWQSHRVALDDLAGADVELIFETRPAEEGTAARGRPVWGAPTVLSRSAAAAPSERPSFVLVSLDTLRARSMSVYGHELATTPRFEELAERGTLFANASTTFSSTYGAHLGMLTGRYFWSSNLSPLERIEGGQGLFLAERLRAAGYSTAAFTENALLRGASGFWNGFATYFEDKQVKRGAGAAAETFERALRWTRAHADRPFFLFVHTYQVHAPYSPPQDYTGLFTEILEEDGPAPPDWIGPIDDATREAIRGARLSYEQEVRYLDQLLAEFISSMEATLGDHPVVFVITSDHGEEFFEHGRALHHQLYEEVLHVPLLVLGPSTGSPGRRIEQSVSLVDIVPTVLELANAGHAPGVDGASLAPLLTDADSATTHVDRVIWATNAQKALGGSGQAFAARRGDHKCVQEEGWPSARCFDLASDPAERVSLSPGAHPAFASLVEELAAYRARLAVGAGEPDGDDALEVDPELQRKLEALGYIE